MQPLASRQQQAATSSSIACERHNVEGSCCRRVWAAAACRCRAWQGMMLDVEADCYWCLSKLLDGIQDHYTYAQPGIQRAVFRLKELIRWQGPAAARACGSLTGSWLALCALRCHTCTCCAPAPLAAHLCTLLLPPCAARSRRCRRLLRHCITLRRRRHRHCNTLRTPAAAAAAARQQEQRPDRGTPGGGGRRLPAVFVPLGQLPAHPRGALWRRDAALGHLPGRGERVCRLPGERAAAHERCPTGLAAKRGSAAALCIATRLCEEEAGSAGVVCVPAARASACVRTLLVRVHPHPAHGTGAGCGAQVYVCAAFLACWQREVLAREFQELVMFLQKLPTADWSDTQIESILSNAYVLRNTWGNAQSHLQL